LEKFFFVFLVLSGFSVLVAVAFLLHLDHLPEYLLRVDAHLLSQLQNLRVQVFVVDIFEVDLLVVLVVLLVGSWSRLRLSLVHQHRQLLFLLLVVG